MKKTLLSFLMLGVAGIVTTQAQITLQSTHIVGQGDIVEQAHDTLPTGITIGSGGASQTWNFSTVANDFLDTTYFVDPTTLPGNTNYPTANLGMYSTSEDSTWIFIDKNTNGLFVLGQSTYIQGNLTPINFAATIVTFPSTMGTNYNGNWDGSLGGYPFGQDPDGPGPHGMVDSIRIYRYATVTSNIDGWGNVTTPFGTFNSLRQVYVEMNEDSTQQLVNGNWEPISAATNNLIQFVLGSPLPEVTYDTTRTARWWTDNSAARFPVIEIDHDAGGNAQSVTYLNASPVGVTEEIANESGVSVYPNPAKDQITFITNVNASNIQVFDITGKLMATHKLNSNQTTLSVTDIDNGVYFYTVYDLNGAVIGSDKFVVAK